mmetsp:Transcript_4147/g.13106  ORF Transcript_4147/g.13106 Transcript_4147/m.13106 type:complete len:212 (+) Transcript_4147:361-996(+)
MSSSLWPMLRRYCARGPSKPPAKPGMSRSTSRPSSGTGSASSFVSVAGAAPSASMGVAVATCSLMGGARSMRLALFESRVCCARFGRGARVGGFGDAFGRVLVLVGCGWGQGWGGRSALLKGGAGNGFSCTGSTSTSSSYTDATSCSTCNRNTCILLDLLEPGRPRRCDGSTTTRGCRRGRRRGRSRSARLCARRGPCRSRGCCRRRAIWC